MTDPHRLDRPTASSDLPDRDRDARIEGLLLTGLDHYFSGRYELAVNVWTRVLFLDRNHARARAYIERARCAISERQREADELFHIGAAALTRGDRAAARELLTSAVERGPAAEDALALLHRLDRLEAASRPDPADAGDDTVQRYSSERPSPEARERRFAWVLAGVLAGVLITAMGAAYLWSVSEPIGLAAPQALPSIVEERLPVPTPAEIRLQRARALAEAGKRHEALRLLESGDPDDRQRAAIDALRTALQRQLLDAASGASQAPPR